MLLLCVSEGERGGGGGGEGAGGGEREREGELISRATCDGTGETQSGRCHRLIC
jgi:hypothetical protein